MKICQHGQAEIEKLFLRWLRSGGGKVPLAPFPVSARDGWLAVLWQFAYDAALLREAH